MIHDALIIGGGPAGSTAAILLAQAGWSVAVVEKSAFPRRKVCGAFLSATNAALLDQLGIGDAFRAAAGPDVRRVALFAGEATIEAPMPRPPCGTGWGRALGRETLDHLLLRRAADVGAILHQPATAIRLVRCPEGHICDLSTEAGSETLRARLVIAAHGSWERGPAEGERPAHHASDLLAFKAYFLGGRLPPDLMPLLAFPGGYGGMVQADGGRISLSLCVRRDALGAARDRHGGGPAGDAVLAHIAGSCRGVREALDGAERDGPWLAAGPIRPGIRKAYADDVFALGNLAGEAHPVIAEGISMAIQSGRLLADTLIRQRSALGTESGRAKAGAAYAAAWRRCFATRIRAAAVFAALAMRPGASALLPFIQRFPAVLTLGARLSGKTLLPPSRSGHREAAQSMS